VTDTGKPGTAGGEPSSKALAQQLGKLAAPVILVILTALVEHYCSYKAPPFGPGAKIVSIDGDSLRAGDDSEYRIFGIDAPELHQTCKEANGKAWACGRAAKARLTTLIKGGNVACEAKGKDRYGRTVAVCSAEGVADLGEAMVRQGYTIDLGGEAGIPITTRKPQRSPPRPASDAGPSTGRQTGAKPPRPGLRLHPG
jgi:endonuclease YncB( thermonuclease family)